MKKVFISFYHGDDQYKRDIEHLFSDLYHVFISNSVQEDDIHPNTNTEAIRQRIRDVYLRDSSVTIVLVGNETWKRKHVDWEIASSIRQTNFNPRSGLLGILLPTYRKINNRHNPFTIPPRLHANILCKYAKLYNWSEDPDEVHVWIGKAFERSQRLIPDNSLTAFARNRTGSQWRP
ncbi:TIR domain-containing protein [Chloroflexota bacterium]